MNITFTPSTTITLYSGVPWKSDYKDIYYTDGITPAGIVGVISQYQVESFSAYSVVKNESTTGVFRVESLFTDLRNCNYCVFQNNVGGVVQPTLAFITDINYINLNTVEISYQIDLISTYIDNISVEYCFVEREHVDSADDIPGNCLEDEGLDTGEFVALDSSDYTVAAGVAVYYLDPDDIQLQSIANVFAPVTVKAAPVASAAGSLSDVFNDVAKEYPERIALCTMVSANMISGSSLAVHETSGAFSISRPSEFYFEGAYVPQNKKLLTSPYLFFTVDNFGGDVERYNFEDFNGGGSNANFGVTETPMPKPCMVAYPVNFKNAATRTNGFYTEEGVVFDNFPACPFPSDSYETWAAMQTQKNTLNNAISVLTIAGGIATAGVTGGAGLAIAASGAASLAGNIGQQELAKKEYKLHSASFGGTIGTAGFNFCANQVGFRAIAYGIKPERAKQIDEYFGTYGYKVNRYKRPNMTGRTFWNFVKCSQADVHGKAPDMALKQMERCLLNGVTFWHTINFAEFDFSANT